MLVMSNETQKREVKVLNKRGFHLRPAEVFMRTASQFESKVELIKDAVRVDGKSMLSLMMLNASAGELITIEATGPDPEQVVGVLEKLFETRFDESE